MKNFGGHTSQIETDFWYYHIYTQIKPHGIGKIRSSFAFGKEQKTTENFYVMQKNIFSSHISPP